MAEGTIDSILDVIRIMVWIPEIYGIGVILSRCCEVTTKSTKISVMIDS